MNERDDAGNDHFTAMLPSYTEKDGNIASIRMWRNPRRWLEGWRTSLELNLQSQATTNVINFTALGSQF